MPDWMPDWIQALYSAEGLKRLIAAGGLALLIAIVFAETGILAGFFLPGDSLLVTAGVLCSVNPLDPTQPPPLTFWVVGVALSLAAIAGDWLNFALGKLAGNRAWSRPDGRFFKRRHLEEAHAFYERWGGLALAAGRFVPIVRTFVPFVAGMAKMRFSAFFAWNVIGALAWVWSMTGLGWWLGTRKELVDRLHLLLLAIIAVSFVPLIVGLARRWLAKRRAAGGVVDPR